MITGIIFTMDKLFVEVASTFKTKLSLSHTQRVTRLYRRALRELNSWAIDRELFCTEAEKIRAQFNANKSLDPHGGLSQRLIREAEQKVFEFTHPDPYVKPYMPGGSKFMRNPPPPLKAIFPDGIPPEYNIASQDVHSIQVPMSAIPEGRRVVLVDSFKKTAE